MGMKFIWESIYKSDYLPVLLVFHYLILTKVALLLSNSGAKEL